MNAPRGGLSHWLVIENKKVANFQLVVPSTWNLGPRCSKGIPSAVEEALVNTPIADPKAPGRNPAHGPFLRPLHRLRGARDRRQDQ